MNLGEFWESLGEFRIEEVSSFNKFPIQEVFSFNDFPRLSNFPI